MAICVSRVKLLQEATGIRRGRVYPVAKNYKPTKFKCNTQTVEFVFFWLQ